MSRRRLVRIILVSLLAATGLVGWRVTRDSPANVAVAADEPKDSASAECPVPEYPVRTEYQQVDGSWSEQPVDGAVERLFYVHGGYIHWVPKGWDAVSATPAQRALVGIPEPPADPADMPRWESIVAKQVGAPTLQCRFPGLSNGI
ncbi:MAG: hypothetical protein U0Q22_04050 [Acidimicrobiales bacterium]